MPCSCSNVPSRTSQATMATSSKYPNATPDWFENQDQQVTCRRQIPQCLGGAGYQLDLVWVSAVALVEGDRAITVEQHGLAGSVLHSSSSLMRSMSRVVETPSPNSGTISTAPP